MWDLSEHLAMGLCRSLPSKLAPPVGHTMMPSQFWGPQTFCMSRHHCDSLYSWELEL